MKAGPKTFLNGWTLKDIILLAGILGGTIHNTSSASDIAKDADETMNRGLTRIETRLATITEHQSGQDHSLVDHETRIRVLEVRK